MPSSNSSLRISVIFASVMGSTYMGGLNYYWNGTMFGPPKMLEIGKITIDDQNQDPDFSLCII